MKPNLLLLSALLAATAPSSEALAAKQYDKRVDGRKVIMVVPDRLSGALPLVVALHGCDQSPGDFLAASGLDRLVDREGLALALPRAPADGGNPLGCWKWWDPDNQRRNGPAPRHMVAVTRSMDVSIDPRRVYALGLSSGGAMAMILGTVYPDVFAAVGVHSGIGFAAAGNAACALKVLREAPGSIEERAALAYFHQAVHRVVPTLVIHGREDEVVDPAHARALIREVSQRNDLIDDGDGTNDSFDDEPDDTLDSPGPCGAGAGSACRPHELERYEDRDGSVVLERVMVDELGHAWSGGREGGGYADPGGPDAALMFWQFFRRHVLDVETLRPAKPRRCRDVRGPPWWHYMWARTMTFSEYTCDLNPWSMVWRHRIGGASGPGPCP